MGKYYDCRDQGGLMWLKAPGDFVPRRLKQYDVYRESGERQLDSIELFFVFVGHENFVDGQCLAGERQASFTHDITFI